MKLDEVYRKTKSELKRAGVDSPAFDAMCLFEFVFGLDRHGLIMNGGSEAEQSKADKLLKLTNRRCSGEPLQYLIEKWEFMGRAYEVGYGVLIPREDTCAVVDAALSAARKMLKSRDSLKIADLCSGSGAIAITLAKELPCEVSAVELYDDAYSYLQKNIKSLKAENVIPVKADIFSCYEDFADSSLDIIISNPPYIKSEEMKTLQREVLREPREALDGGEDGYIFYRRIIKDWSKKLSPTGAICFELGEGQYEKVERLLLEQGYTDIGCVRDIQEIQRCIYGYKK